MRFLVYGPMNPEILTAMKRHDQTCHMSAELNLATDGAAAVGEGAHVDDALTPVLLLPALEKKQWNLLTTDAEFIHDLYERKVQFSGVIILLLAPATTADPIDRLFARYPRLTPRRLYTVTSSRVKIRQLPGAAQA